MPTFTIQSTECKSGIIGNTNFNNTSQAKQGKTKNGFDWKNYLGVITFENDINSSEIIRERIDSITIIATYSGGLSLEYNMSKKKPTITWIPGHRDPIITQPEPTPEDTPTKTISLYTYIENNNTENSQPYYPYYGYHYHGYNHSNNKIQSPEAGDFLGSFNIIQEKNAEEISTTIEKNSNNELFDNLINYLYNGNTLISIFSNDSTKRLKEDISNNYVIITNLKFEINYTEPIYKLTIDPNGGEMYKNNTEKTKTPFDINFKSGYCRFLGNFETSKTMPVLENMYGNVVKKGYSLKWDNPLVKESSQFDSNPLIGYVNDNLDILTIPQLNRYYIFDGRDVEEDVTIKAKWEPWTYYLLLDGLAFTAQPPKYGETITLPTSFEIDNGVDIQINYDITTCIKNMVIGSEEVSPELAYTPTLGHTIKHFKMADGKKLKLGSNFNYKKYVTENHQTINLTIVYEKDSDGNPIYGITLPYLNFKNKDAGIYKLLNYEVIWEVKKDDNTYEEIGKSGEPFNISSTESKTYELRAKQKGVFSCIPCIVDQDNNKYLATPYILNGYQQFSETFSPEDCKFVSQQNIFSCPQFIPPSGAVLDILVTNENTKAKQLNENVKPEEFVGNWVNATYYFYLEEKKIKVNFDTVYNTSIAAAEKAEDFTENDKYSFTFYWKIPQLYPVTPYIYQ